MGKKILLADDSITIQKVIELTFSDEDFEVVTVGNGRLAIERVLDVRPDIVLCDIIMPEKDGYEVCDYIKKHASLSHVPVLLLTGAFEPFDQERAARVGSDGFLAKPFEPQTLIAKVKDLLNQAASRRPAAAPPVTGARPAVAPPVAPPAPMMAPVPAPQPPPPPAYVPPPPPPAYVPPPAPPAAAPPWSAPPPPPPPPAPEPPSWAPQPAPAWTVAGRAPVPAPPIPAPVPATANTWGQPGTAEVNFISDEPYAEAVPEAPPDALEPLEAAVPESTAAATLDDDLYVPESTGAVELMDVGPEESESLQSVAAAAADAVPESGGWVQPTMEVSLEDRAQASVAAHEGERVVFEEVFEREPEAEPAPPPAAPAMSTPREFEPEFAPADEAPAATPIPPSFEPEFDDATSTVMFNAGDLPVAPPEPPAPPPPPPPPAPMPPMQAEIPTFRPAPAPYIPPAPPPRYEEPDPIPPPSVYESPRTMPMAPPEPEPEPEPEPLQEEPSFSDIAPLEDLPAPAPSAAAEVGVPVEMVSQIAQRVVAQISDKVVREIAWEVIPELAETLIRKEIERLKAELAKI